jgi:hypothetical protein
LPDNETGGRNNPPVFVADQPTVPPFASHAAADFAGSHPWPLQEFWPLHALLAVLQALVPLQELIPMHMTVLAAFLAEAGVADRPPMASAIAAKAMVAPDAVFVFMLIISS